ncbi:unnamed protein product [Rotaria socialis]|uniref:Tc1-like transposase DDE domain-containing protein n=1 Tax=Rotaria socialis TaxID=392032 RepID=A0A818GT92_9BILA|nr:unnamed protein product [Rotaria socialis]
MSQQRNLSTMKTKRSTILHYWNNGHRSPATIARVTKIPIRTVKYNIVKIKNQGTIEDRRRKITANDDKALGQWIRRNNIARTGTPMFAQKHKEACVQWAIQHKDDRLSFIQNNYEWSFLCSNFSTSSYPQCQEANFIDDGNCSKLMIRSTEVPEVIDWPSNSPDINPIENVWSIIKRHVEKRYPKSFSKSYEITMISLD